MVSPELQPKSINTSASEIDHSESGTRRPRLVFIDYLIKPVQRICRYPLLFHHFLSFSPPDHHIADRALHAMHAVASAVDDARGRQELSVKSNLIVSRLCQGISMSIANASRPYHAQPLTPGFLSSLGLCLTTGSLDIILYHRSTLGKSNTVTAKYLAAFLFPGEFLIFAKVLKASSSTQPWTTVGFPLTSALTVVSRLSSPFTELVSIIIQGAYTRARHVVSVRKGCLDAGYS